MKKYRVILSYAMSLDFKVDAIDEEEAMKIANDKADRMSDADFVVKGEPQFMESSVEEIK